ncbi:hypothetical protein RAH32_12210 [Paracoccus sp. WLY502]|uniref:hypothetical protein n=1 Tax=Paracoccus yibinensis TaxID=3068891 RepID=UPI002796A4A2|nr:hypothetical protein [Paracoccus sp. WLY502]MDQ1901205.1 hypothetical protein [Paracoccus sp. WLY502]
MVRPGVRVGMDHLPVGDGEAFGAVPRLAQDTARAPRRLGHDIRTEMLDDLVEGAGHGGQAGKAGAIAAAVAAAKPSGIGVGNC